MECESILQKIKNTYIDVLGENLVGIYVHGSIAFSCFNWEKSDVDFIAVVNRQLTTSAKMKLMEFVLLLNQWAPPQGIEMSIVLKEYCLNFIYPTPFDLHFSKGQMERYINNPQNYCENMNGEDKDLAAHFTVIKNTGIVLYGDEIDHVFGDIPKAAYIDSLKCDIDGAKERVMDHPLYIILNLCRILAYLKNDLILSKADGGKWGLKHLDVTYHPIIAKAVSSYQFNTELSVSREAAENFCDYMLGQILADDITSSYGK